MDLLKALKRTTLPAIAVLALGATRAFALNGGVDSCTSGDCTDVLAHCSASVTAALNIVELQSINFGNMHIPTPTSPATTAGGSTVTISATGKRSGGAGPDAIALLYGSSQSSGFAGNDTGANSGDTGAGAAGYYHVSNGSEAATQVYVTFADAAGNLVDSEHQNFVEMALTTDATKYFLVNGFTFQSATATGTPPDAGYSAAGASVNDNFGNYILLSSNAATLEVGATMTTIAGLASYPPGKYIGEFNIMVSY